MRGELRCKLPALGFLNNIQGVINVIQHQCCRWRMSPDGVGDKLFVRVGAELGKKLTCSTPTSVRARVVVEQEHVCRPMDQLGAVGAKAISGAIQDLCVHADPLGFTDTTAEKLPDVIEDQ
jgi:hypothetical protein